MLSFRKSSLPGAFTRRRAATLQKLYMLPIDSWGKLWYNEATKTKEGKNMITVNGMNEVGKRWIIARYILGDYWFINAWNSPQEAADYMNNNSDSDLCLIDANDMTVVMW